MFSATLDHLLMRRRPVQSDDMFMSDRCASVPITMFACSFKRASVLVAKSFVRTITTMYFEKYYWICNSVNSKLHHFVLSKIVFNACPCRKSFCPFVSCLCPFLSLSTFRSYKEARILCMDGLNTRSISALNHAWNQLDAQFLWRKSLAAPRTTR